MKMGAENKGITQLRLVTATGRTSRLRDVLRLVSGLC